MAAATVIEPVEGPLDTTPLDAPTGFFDRVHRDESPHTQSAEQSPRGTARRRPQPLGSGSVTPSGRRSVQFARGPSENEPAPSPLKRTPTWETEDEGGEEDETGKRARERRERQASFMGRLKAMASPASSSFHVRTSSNNTAGMATPTAALSPQSERSEPLYPVLSEEEHETGDADAEEDSNDERKVGSTRAKRKRKMKRPQLDGSAASSSTPMATRFASFIKDHQLSSSSANRPESSSRRATMSDIGEDTRRAGVSEDEGKDKIRNAWKRGIDGARAISYSTRRQQESEETPGEKRPSNLRRFTGMDAMSSSVGRMRTERIGSGSGSTQRWRQVKAGLKMLGQKKRDERATVDYQKSAQLMAELLAGAPAALVFASMFQRDEHDHRKIPVLLEQLKIRIPSSQTKETKTGDRHMIFRIELEYGNGPARMNWVIYRNLRDFVNLHLKYKVQGKTEKLTLRSDDKTKPKIPHFPKTAFPYARGARGLFAGLDDEPDDDELLEESGREPETPGLERPGKHRRRRSSFVLARRQSSIGNAESGGNTAEREARERNIYNERQRKKLEKYLQQMIRWLIFRPDSTRLCKFLELSALSIRLSSEGGYVGKQGILTIASRQNRELRRTALRGPQGFTARHKPRWALVRHSYIVMVDGPESLVPYEVFLVDSDFSTDKDKKRLRDQSAQEMAKTATESSGKNHILRLHNSERKLKLIAKNERQFHQFKESIEHMASNTVWSKKQRFGSFAPIRDNVWARWLVDARDHMWQVSRAIDNAKDCIYIHDWWLSPELYLRRPAAISQKWRLDRLLQRKADEGVKIFVVVYRNIESAIPIDSEYTKWSLLDLHENICVQRSPNQFRQNQFFWAHHEKLVVVDNMMAFVGGVDLCFGRWDDPCHALTDDKLTGFELDHQGPRDAEHCQVWPGKDYSNPRVQDFYALDRPYEEMYDRTKVPRMPWHDIAMQIIGQPARDVGRHFVQRWNYVLRQRVPTRPTPVLMPPPEYEHGELERLGMTGTCQIQILRSCSPWSIGTPNKVEHSIMNAYCNLIEASDHYIYIENQFYISSTSVDGTVIHNGIGDALVERAIRAAENGEDWQACLIIPLMPGFQNSVDSQDGTSVRLIMQCQYRSINRGEGSIFGRLRAAGVNPEKYIKFFSLRQWGKIGPKKCLTTEQLYIHAKCMIVDDRHVIIGSANINERSMLGSRDSEVASLVTDKMMLPSHMAGRPYMVGEFAHSLRKRLMREHLGLDVDAIYRRDQIAKEREQQDMEMNRIYREDFATPGTARSEYFETPPQTPMPHALTNHNLEASANGFAGEKADLRGWVKKAQSGRSDSDDSIERQSKHHGEKPKKASTDLKQHDLDVQGYGVDNEKQLQMAGDVGLRDTYINAQGHEVFRSRDAPDIERIRQVEDAHVKKQSAEDKGARNVPRPPWPMQRNDTFELGLSPRYQLPELPAQDDTDIGGPALTHQLSRVTTRKTVPLVHTLQKAEITEDCMSDPLAPHFMEEIWNRVAENNTKIYRQVFRTMPDSEVLDWDDYKRFNDYNERFMQSQGLGHTKPKAPKDAPPRSGPPGSAGTDSLMTQMMDEKSAAAKGAKGLFSNITNRARPNSKKSNDSHPQSQELNEKNGESPDSGISRAPTAVPTPDDRPLDEKDFAKEANTAQQKHTSTEGPLSLAPQTSKSEAPQVEDSGVSRQRTITLASDLNDAPETTATQSHTTNGIGLQHATSQKRRRRATTKSSARPPTMVEEVMSKEDAEELLNMVQGHLVLWPYDW